MTSENHAPAWELSKENAAPLQRGRNVAALERALDDSEETRDIKERQVDRFERLVKPSEQENFNAEESTSASQDPLVHWLGYIKFHQEFYPTNTHNQFLLMERCFRSLSRFRRYANDIRFIRLCCQYAEKTERPNEIFKYLYQQKIGDETAIFWIAWGFVAEKREEWAFANDIYTKGIRKRAKPLEKLNKRYREFQRRMARHWLNATQTQDDDENPSTSRGVLGALSEEAVERNDRSAPQPPGPSFLRRSRQDDAAFSDRSRRAPASNSSNQPAPAAFPIFVENDGPSQNLLDSSFSHGEMPYRQLEREQDRKKENSHMPERWNDRGGYTSTYGQARAASKPKPRTGNPPPFAVYVDEECAEQQKREELRREREHECHRRVRDERTFRERDDLCFGDTLFKDPLRYVRDPSQLEIDQRAQNQSITANNTIAVAKRKANAGFSTRLLRHPDTGDEQNFEEARALAKYFKLTPPSTDVNHLITSDPCDNMMIDDGSDDDESMTSTSDCPPVRKRPFAQRRKSLMIPQNGSMEIPTPRNASTASSTVEDDGDAAFHRADPTINTQIAMKELSMMFSSPAMGLNESKSEALNRSGGLGPILNESGVSIPAEDRSMAAIDEGDTAGSNGFQIFDENDTKPKAVGFQILDESAAQEMCKPSKSSFAIFDEAEMRKCDHTEQNSKPATSGFSIYCEEEEGTEQSNRKTGQEKFGLSNDAKDTTRNSRMPHVPAHSVTGDEFGNLSHISGDGNEIGLEKKKDKQMHSEFKIYEDESADKEMIHKSTGPAFSIFQDNGNEEEEDGGGDTATLSLFDEAMSILDEANDKHEKRKSDCVNTEKLKRRKSNVFALSADIPDSFGDISAIIPSEDVTETIGPQINATLESATDYGICHKKDVKNAIQRLSSRSIPFPKNRKSLEKILTTQSFICNLPSHVLPNNLRLQKAAVSSGTSITLGRSSATVKQELGRGAYGCVLLLDVEGNTDVKAAVKAQSPVGSLAWEYEILDRLRDRFKKKFGASSNTPFPDPLSFVSLADGALLTMEAVSSSGLNFIDLINVHRQHRGEPALPEILAIHYVSRMLYSLENLHWVGRILHCDTKADNWVLSASDLIDNDMIEASDVILTDFGRAVDLEDLESASENPLDRKLKGRASRDDMMCVAMQKGLPWSFDIDTYGLCDTAHVLLFGSGLNLVRDVKTGRWGPKQRLRRYHQTDLWTCLFDTLLNLEEPGKVAIGSRPGSLRQIRIKFEEYLKKNQAQVKAQLKHQATFLPTKRPTGSP